MKKFEITRTVYQTQTVSVKVDDLDLTTEEGKEELEYRLREEADDKYDWDSISSEYEFHID